jgi:hypothetical protein
MILTSSSFKDGEQIDVRYSCNGEGIIPNLNWCDYPDETESFAIILEDPDASIGTFVHWTVINIPDSINFLEEGTGSIQKSKEIENSSGKTTYVPPCPAIGIHRYIFKIYALSIDKLDDVNIDNFYDKIKPYTIDSATLTGKYGK